MGRVRFHTYAFLVALAGLLAFAATPLSARMPENPSVRSFAAAMGLRDIDGFVETVETLRQTGKLPPRYLTKDDAARAGWRPGDDLCRAAPGRAIGGDRFGNREGRLPDKPGRVWREADLDFACGRRGARRLVWSNDGLIYVTVDHYRSFHAVPS